MSASEYMKMRWNQQNRQGIQPHLAEPQAAAGGGDGDDGGQRQLDAVQHVEEAEAGDGDVSRATTMSTAPMSATTARMASASCRLTANSWTFNADIHPFWRAITRMCWQDA
jgi:hypothetical protein